MQQTHTHSHQQQDIIVLGGERTFTLVEAQNVVQVIKRITKESADKVDLLAQQIQFADSADSKRVEELELVSQKIFQDWETKVRKLGGHVKGMWLVDFDNGSGYFCWKYPEPEILFWHDYQDGFTGRKQIN